ncbi:MAG: hypothetical protein AB8G18_12290 [Gammaproteobacteria bacterium]
MKNFDREPSPAWLDKIVGAICSIIGLFLLLISIVTGYEAVFGKDQGAFFGFAIVLVIGLFFTAVGFRLLTGTERKGGGLLSPTILRIGALIFLSAPIVMLIEGEILKAIGKAVSLVLASIACFALAARRAREED